MHFWLKINIQNGIDWASLLLARVAIYFRNEKLWYHIASDDVYERYTNLRSMQRTFILRGCVDI